jgi:hypothetical protein
MTTIEQRAKRRFRQGKQLAGLMHLKSHGAADKFDLSGNPARAHHSIREIILNPKSLITDRESLNGQDPGSEIRGPLESRIRDQ